MSSWLQTGKDAGLRSKGWLRPLVPLYRAALLAKDVAYAQHWRTRRSLQAPVISVGNLSVGGAGKTPLIIRLAILLAERGLAVDVLTRGYGRRSTSTERVEVEMVAPAAPYGAERFGDEPILIAGTSGVPVYVGASRYAAGLLAEQRATSSARVHLLDDGFQHRKLTRAVDIVVLHASDFRAGLLPAGRLREPLSALGRASIAVLKVEDASFAALLGDRFPGLPIWWVRREIVVPPHRPPALAFCGIAHPGEFFGALRSAGVALSETRAFADHHPYTDRDIAALLERAQRTGAGSLLTTEKDLVRLSPAQRSRLSQAAMLEAVPLVVRLLDEQARIDQVLRLARLASLVP